MGQLCYPQRLSDVPGVGKASSNPGSLVVTCKYVITGLTVLGRVQTRLGVVKDTRVALTVQWYYAQLVEQYYFS